MHLRIFEAHRVGHGLARRIPLRAQATGVHKRILSNKLGRGTALARRIPSDRGAQKDLRKQSGRGTALQEEFLQTAGVRKGFAQPIGLRHGLVRRICRVAPIYDSPRSSRIWFLAVPTYLRHPPTLIYWFLTGSNICLLIIKARCQVARYLTPQEARRFGSLQFRHICVTHQL